MRATSPASLTARSASTAPPAAHQLDAVGQQLAQPRVASHGHLDRPRTRAGTRPSGQPSDSAALKSCGASSTSKPSTSDPACSDVAEVGDEAAQAGTHDGHAVGAREPGQVAHVDEVGDEQRVDLERVGQAVGAAHSASFKAAERVAVAVHALAADLRHADAVEHRHAPERLAVLDVGQVHLHRRQPGDLDGVAQRPRVVRPGARVEQQPVGVVGRLVDLLDVVALVVGLEEPGLQARARGRSRRSGARAARTSARRSGRRAVGRARRG